MDITDRIDRRRRTGERGGLVVDPDPLSPVWHPDEPVGRGPLVERLLDHLDPVFDGDPPPNGYLAGPAGSGKSAVTRALVDRLAAALSSSGDAVYTTTRGGSVPGVSFASLDLREGASAFEFHHDLLDALTTESVPRRGVGTDDLRERIERRVRGSGPVVVVVDHVDEPETVPLSTAADRLGALDGTYAWLAVGRDDPESVSLPADTATLTVDPYSKSALGDVLAARADAGLGQGALAHGTTRRLAEWAEGDAGVALSALLGAVEAAEAAGATTVDAAHVDAGMAAVPWPCVPLGRVLALPTNRIRTLACLVALDPADRAPVGDCAARIAERVDLTASTVERFLYELAEAGIVERVRVDAADGPGRPPSRVDPRFPTLAFRRLARHRLDATVA